MRDVHCVFLSFCGLMCFSVSLFCLCWHVYLRWLFSQYTLTSGCPLARCYRWKMLFVSLSLSLSPWATSAKLIHHISPEGPIFSLSLSFSHTHTEVLGPVSWQACTVFSPFITVTTLNIICVYLMVQRNINVISEMSFHLSILLASCVSVCLSSRLINI